MSVTTSVIPLNIENIKRLRKAVESVLASVAADKLRVSVVDALPESPFNITKVAGTALTGRDWSLDFMKLQNLDVALSSRASEATQLMHFANDYNPLTIDLGIARTDELIESNVIAFCVVDATSGATYSLKLFNTTKPAIDQSIAKPGFCLERLALANLYLTNSAQTGYVLKILVLKRV